mmetsp:Transcript_27794/g.41134  ORF Transcript_27794/g.41134 Transcript_27794/m.41134 type:complete len:225 (+) Transcript_27794:109-783(+)|eukprot:CAMPEP_0195535714 /NCGR_PEP_ID=MMETSP0794_2-20130614/44801_1 /TAXON_ID=515487 /ORGANISM="Stephanopyxis turris, Strain CCMP 815" /LENGTH=224 /DNA_ID=CAMNT_0040668935 /DNA_START=98 /DNA_END=772 /DNA_ORIENTATION=-
MNDQNNKQQPLLLIKLTPLKVRLTAFVITTIAVILSIVTAKSCRFVEYKSAAAVMRKGLYQEETIFGLCQPYGANQEFDTNHRAAMIFGALSALIGGFSAIGMYYQLFFQVENVSLWRASVSIFLLVSFLFQILTFLAFNDQRCETYKNCKIASGASCSIAATIFYLVSALATLKMPPPEGPLLKCDCSSFLVDAPCTEDIEDPCEANSKRKQFNTDHSYMGSE